MNCRSSVKSKRFEEVSLQKRLECIAAMERGLANNLENPEELKRLAAVVAAINFDGFRPFVDPKGNLQAHASKRAIL
jgi:hypothetical protein